MCGLLLCHLMLYIEFVKGDVGVNGALQVRNRGMFQEGGICLGKVCSVPRCSRAVLLIFFPVRDPREEWDISSL